MTQRERQDEAKTIFFSVVGFLLAIVVMVTAAFGWAGLLGTVAVVVSTATAMVIAPHTGWFPHPLVTPETLGLDYVCDDPAHEEV